MAPGQHSQHFIFSVTYKSVLKARALDYIKFEWFASYKHSSLLGTFISYKKWSVVNIAPGLLS